MSEEGNEEGLGGLFDDSPDSEAESEPGSPDLMSAAWVEEMARDPLFQQLVALRAPPGADIMSALEGLDLSPRERLRSALARRELIAVHLDAARAQQAVAAAQTAELHRQVAELHVTNHTAGG